MRFLSETLSSFAQLEEALTGELGRIERERELLRRLDSERLFESAAEGMRFNERLGGLLAHAQASLAGLCEALGAEASTVEALERAAPTVAAPVRLAVDAAKAAGRRLELAQAFNRDVTARALSLVRALEQRLPVTGAAYGRAGRVVSSGRAITTSRRA